MARCRGNRADATLYADVAGVGRRLQAWHTEWMSGHHNDTHGSSRDGIPTARVVPHGLGEQARELGHEALAWSAMRARQGYRVASRVMPMIGVLCLLSAASIAISALSDPVTERYGEIGQDSSDIEMRMLEWRQNVELDLRHLERQLELIRIDDQLYLYDTRLLNDIRATGLFHPNAITTPLHQPPSVFLPSGRDMSTVEIDAAGMWGDGTSVMDESAYMTGSPGLLVPVFDNP